MVAISVQGKRGQETTEQLKVKPRIEAIRVEDFDLSAQTREKIDDRAAKDYAVALDNGAELPPGIAVRDQDGRLFLAAGHHRLLAHRMSGKRRMRVHVIEGTRFDALRIGVEDNSRNLSVRLSSLDRKAAAAKLLQEDPTKSSRDIAAIVGLSHSTVNRLRTEMEATGTLIQSDIRVGRDGRQIDTERIGEKVVTKATEVESADSQPHEPSTPCKLPSEPSTISRGNELPADSPTQGIAENTLPTSSGGGQPFVEVVMEPPTIDALEKVASEAETASETPQQLEGGMDSVADREASLLVKAWSLAKEAEKCLEEVGKTNRGRFAEAAEGFVTISSAIARWND